MQESELKSQFKRLSLIDIPLWGFGYETTYLESKSRLHTSGFETQRAVLRFLTRQPPTVVFRFPGRIFRATQWAQYHWRGTTPILQNVAVWKSTLSYFRGLLRSWGRLKENMLCDWFLVTQLRFSPAFVTTGIGLLESTVLSNRLDSLRKTTNNPSKRASFRDNNWTQDLPNTKGVIHSTANASEAVQKWHEFAYPIVRTNITFRLIQRLLSFCNCNT
jgi:hypothetical protein